MSDHQVVLGDFKACVYLIWKHLGLRPRPELDVGPTEIQYDIADYLQGGPRRRMVKGFRGVAKSWEAAALTLWWLKRDPNERILVVSAAKDRADAFTYFTKKLIEEIPFFHDLRPQKGQRDSQVQFDVGPSDAAHAPSVKSIGITGQLQGPRATKIIADDVSTLKNSMTQTMREHIGELIKEFDSIITPGGEIVFLGTDQIEQSLYHELPSRGYDVRIWPARYPKPEMVENYEKTGAKLGKLVSDRLEENPELAYANGGRGAPTDPDRFNDLDLMEREASYGRSGFSLQFMLDTTVSDANRYPLKVSDLVVMPINELQAPVNVVWANGPEQLMLDADSPGLAGDRFYRPMHTSPEWDDYTGSMMFIDPSGRGKDETAYAVIKHLRGKLFLMESGGFRGGYDMTTLVDLARAAKRHQVNLIQTEPNYGGGMFTELFKPVLQEPNPEYDWPGYQCAVEDADWASGQKELRIIDTVEPVMNQHRLVVSPAVIQADARTEEPEYRLFYQMTRLSRERGSLGHDDRIEAVFGAIKYWVESMAVRQQSALDDYKERKLDEYLRKFKENVNTRGHLRMQMGTAQPQQQTWVKHRR